ncbi:uncharacterized protein [Cicer arietinum]|uniref:Uncharacterized protein LOC101505776 n=1 Tax=Cicer arietinum TaxID=3827 RepID=A0A1S2Z8B1_CICAR|nr:uncharacterized protein LOC101505776 [Cicer arietinum]
MYPQFQKEKKSQGSVSKNKGCEKCEFNHGDQSCLAARITCLKYGKVGNFARCCKNVILGMDWLSLNHAVINCYDKSIFLAPQSMTIDSPLFKCFMYALAFHKYLVEGAQGYMLLFSSNVEVEDNLTLIHVVCEFPNVFPKDVSSLLPNRELELPIDLVLGCGPISVTPYRMSALELDELKKQLEDLLEKIFIRPSVSS